MSALLTVPSRITKAVKWRIDFLRNCRELNIFQKISVLSRRDVFENGRRMVRALLRWTTDGERYFQFRNFRFFFEPSSPSGHEDQLLQGMSIILSETFLFPEIISPETSIKSGDIVIDLGANIGSTAAVYSELVGPGGHVYAVEPVTCDIFERNMQVNGINNVTLIRKAMSDKNGMAEILVSGYVIDSCLAGKAQMEAAETKKLVVETCTLDSLVDELKLDRLDVIKVDIEGAEELALRGAARTIAKFRPRWSVSSYHIDFANEPQHDKLVKILKDYGYRVRENEKSHIYAW